MIELQAFRENAGDSAKLGKEGSASRSCLEFPPTSSPLHAGRAGTDMAPPGWAERARTCPARAAQPRGPHTFPPRNPGGQRNGGTCPKLSPPGGNPGPPSLKNYHHPFLLQPFWFLFRAVRAAQVTLNSDFTHSTKIS